jgi:hypothetical protein
MKMINGSSGEIHVNRLQRERTVLPGNPGRVAVTTNLGDLPVVVKVADQNMEKYWTMSLSKGTIYGYVRTTGYA